MRLSAIASLVCAKVGLSDATNLALCKQFIAQRYRMVWDEGLWLESLFCVNRNVPWDSTGYDKLGEVFLPQEVDKVIGGRLTDGPVSPIEEQDLYRFDLDLYEETGRPTNFMVRPPAIWRMGIEKGGSALPGNLTFLYSGGSSSLNTGKILHLHVIGNNPDYSASQGDDVRLNRVIDIDMGFALDGFAITGGFTLIERITMDALVSEVYAVDNARSDTEASFYVRAGITEMEPCQRVQMVRIPTEATSVRFLVKRKCPPLSSDYDTTMLTGVDNCLIAFAQADLLEKMRQYGKATAKTTEGMALLEQLKRGNLYQQARATRVIPEVEPDAIHHYRGGKGDFLA
jgi:hypothetical protein